jgi:hypothetical protein
MNTITEETGTAQATVERPKSRKKAHVAQKRAHVAPKKAKPLQKTPQAAKQTGEARIGSKAAKILDLLKRPEGVTLAAFMKATEWQARSVRGFLSGTLRKKLGLTIESTKGEDGERIYSVKG